MNSTPLLRSRDRMLERAHRQESAEPVEKTLHIVEQILQEFPGDIEALLLQARLWIRLGRIGAAHYQLERLAERASDNVEVRLTLVGVLFCLGYYDRAIDHLQVATRLCESAKGERVGDNQKREAVLRSLWQSYADIPQR